MSDASPTVPCTLQVYESIAVSTFTFGNGTVRIASSDGGQSEGHFRSMRRKRRTVCGSPLS
ncbi:hypothetical protein DENSPDRAFT_842179 [Dentipellis sp. KUC8613]|nr:hypothetical protein DENSPDRAFT_842179 [Dentipellis sp. KUC8613]